MGLMSAFLIQSFMTVCVAMLPGLPQRLELPATQDNSIVMVDGEWSQNAGRQGRLRIKGNQHIVAMSFDVSALAGKRVTGATLICERAEQEIEHLTISTIATPWSEAQSNGLWAGVEGIPGWGYEGARFPAVCGGNAGTLVHHVESKIVGGRYHWTIPPDLVHAMSNGIAFGLALHEHSADYSRNPTIYSRDQSGRAPVLVVDVEDQPEITPGSVTELRVRSVSATEVELSFVPPASGFCYEITVNEIPLARHNIPLVRQGLDGGRETVALRDLPAAVTTAATQEVRVVTRNRTGQVSAAAVLRGNWFRKAEVPAVTAATGPSGQSSVGLSVIPVTDKYDAAGQPVGKLPADYRTSNPLFDGQRVWLIAAAGEVVSFQLLVRGIGDVQVELTLDPEIRTELWRGLYVPAGDGRIVDPLLPLSQPVQLQSGEDTVVVGDLFVPFDARPGTRSGLLSLSDGRRLPIELTVLPFALPREASFVCEMNGYGLPERVEDYYQLQRLACDHRVHSNILHYSHNTAAPGARKSNLDMRLLSGRRMDNQKYDRIEPGATTAWWEDFAEAFGPCLDGSLFAKSHRGPVPVPGFYLTFHESWPLNCRQFFNGDPDAYRAFAETPVYGDTFANVLDSFVKLADERGWHQTRFQVYLNNKGSLLDPAKAPWILDEPSGFWDYRALRYFGELTDRGTAKASSVKIDYRMDISRPEYARGQLDGRRDLWVVSSSAFRNYRRLVMDRMRQEGIRVWIYGTSNQVWETNRNLQAWALDSWRFGATGLVPWQTVNKDGSALKQADQLGLFIFDRDAEGQTVIRHSLRLKAWRDAQQLIEYLQILQRRRGWTQEQMQEFIADYVPLDGEIVKTNEEDAGTSSYGGVTPLGLELLRRATAQLIAEP